MLCGASFFTLGKYGIFFDELVITILENGASQNHIQLLMWFMFL